MEGNLVVDEDGAINCQLGRRKAGCGTGSGVRFYLRHVLTFNDEAKDKLKMRQLNSPRTKTAFELARRDREQTTNVFECLLQTA
jgi:hypothetical protein